MKHLYLILAFALLSGYASATDVWSGEFDAKTADGKVVGFLGTYPKKSSDCIQDVVRSIVVELDHKTFMENFDLYMNLAKTYSAQECGLD